MIIRVGVEPGRPAVLERVRRRHIPVLISANAFWDDRTRRFRNPGQSLYGLDLALDSGGFVAMKLYRGYRYTVSQYVGLAARLEPAWWAAMDFCCEPEIAVSNAAVQTRIESTVDSLEQCQEEALAQRVPAPMPVLQGWRPEDYLGCFNSMSQRVFPRSSHWPALVGVGSVCRRHLHGPNGLFQVLNTLDRVLPPHVRLHLFGVKGAVLARVVHRVESIDSMAWNMAARWHAHHTNQPCPQALRAQFMENWFERQMAHLNNPQLSLSI